VNLLDAPGGKLGLSAQTAMKNLLLLATLAGVALAQPTLLPNGWRIDPAGRQIPLDTMPSTSLATPDGKHLLVLHQGANPPSIAVLSLPGLTETSRVSVPDAWQGMTMTQNGRFIYVAGASQSAIYEFSLSEAGELKNTRTFEVTPAATRTPDDFVGGVTLSPNDRLLYATLLYRDMVIVINPQSGRVIERVKTGRRPYQIVFHPLGASFFVSSWANAAVYQHRAETAEAMGMTRVGPHATGMVISDLQPKLTEEDEGVKIDWKYRLFVTAANTNRVDVLGISERGEVRSVETINVGLFPRQPVGMTPTALALSPDQSTLYVVCSDANAVAVVDVSHRRSQVHGFLPTGWYPLAANALKDGRLLVTNGHGKTLSAIDPVTEQTLGGYTKRVLANMPYRDELLDATAGGPAVEHVIYVIKEGDAAVPEGAVRFDRFQASGASWATAAIATDYEQKKSPRNQHDDAREPTAMPPAGYLWTNATAAGLTVTTDFNKFAESRLTVLRLNSDADLAPILAAVRKSPAWRRTAIFVHGNPAYVLSPLAKGGVDSTAYNTLSMLRTVELLLGLKPMTHFDAAAQPMWSAFARP
jgi:YVTN family beta-propeller protein